ncbi:MAG: hypothetical protein WBD31_32755 [Rubripirellula sp.]
MPKRNTRLRWSLVIALAIVWPLAVVFVVQPLAQRWGSVRPLASAADLQMLMNVRRYEVQIPDDKDNWFLGVSGVVDGKEHSSGGGTVPSGSTVVLLLQRSDDARMKYCWYHENSVMHGSIANPLIGASVSTERMVAQCKPGDWLIRGGRDSVSTRKPADFEVRVSLSPPVDDEGHEGHDHVEHTEGSGRLTFLNWVDQPPCASTRFPETGR